MIEAARKRRKASISEDDIAVVLQRYPATTVLALLKEVARFSDAKLDWKELVKNTETGISNAREYQMLWRHLAYRQDLLDEVEDRAEPLDDDSDLEYELAASPLVSHEASAEALACVKVLMECGSSDSGNPGCTMVEAPLTINIPNGHSSNALPENSKTPCLMQGINITVPICVQKQPVPASTSMEGIDACGTTGGNMPPRRKRKPWTEAEDVELISAVQKYGEGNWANIVKKDYKGDRTASQLSQRWAIIRKKNGSVSVGGASVLSIPQLSEAQLATRNANYAVNLALDPPVKNITSSSSVGPAGTGVNATPSNSVRPKSDVGRSMLAGHQSQLAAGKGLNATSRNSMRLPNADTSCSVQAVHQSQQAGTGLNSKSSNSASPNAEASSSVQAAPQSQQAGTGLKAAASNSVNPLNQSQQGPILSKSSPAGTLGLSPKSRIIAKKALPKSIHSSDSKVIATAVAAGARIATKSVADSVIKAAKSVHIMPTGGGSLMKPSTPGAATTHVPGHPNVHFIRTGRATTTASAPTRTATSAIQRSSSISSSLPNVSSKQTNGTQDVKTTEETKISQTNIVRREQVQGDGACVVADSSSNNEPKEQAQKDGACVVDAPSKNGPEEQVQRDGACVAVTPSKNGPEEQVQRDGACVADTPSKNGPEEQVQRDGACVADTPSKNVLEEQSRKDGACVADGSSKNVAEDRVQKDGACAADGSSKNVAEDRVPKDGACAADGSSKNVAEERSQKGAACVAGAQSKTVAEERVQRDSACVAVAQSKNVAEERVQKDSACVAGAHSKAVAQEQVQRDGACVAGAHSKAVAQEQVQRDGACVAAALSKNVAEEQARKDGASVVDAESSQVEDRVASSKQAGLKEEGIVEDLLKLKTTAHVAKKAEERQDTIKASQNNDKTEVSQVANLDTSKTKVSQDSSQHDNKTEVSQEANLDKKKTEESQGASLDKNNSEEDRKKG